MSTNLIERIELINTPIEITTRGASLRLELTAEERAKGFAKAIDLLFWDNGQLSVSWIRAMPQAHWLSLDLSDEQRTKILRLDPQSMNLWVSHATDNVVLLHDFHIAAAYWGPRTGVIRLTREAITEAYTSMAGYGVECHRPSAYNQATTPITASQLLCV